MESVGDISCDEAMVQSLEDLHTNHSFLCTMHSLQSKCTCDELFAHPLGLSLQNQAEQFNSACQLIDATSQNVGVNLHWPTF